MLSKFQSIWEGQTVCTTAAKQCIDLLDNNTQPEHWAPFRAGPKIRVFKKAEIDKTLNQKVIAPVLTEWAALIKSASKNTELSHYALMTESWTLSQSVNHILSFKWTSASTPSSKPNFLSTLDANSEYGRLEIEKSNRHKTTFMAEYGR